MDRLSFEEKGRELMDEKEIWKLVFEYGKDILATESMKSERGFMQHGRVSVYRHSLNVAFASLYLARKWKWRVNERTLVRGALLHDSFLYDGHEPSEEHKWHGFIHAEIALKNAVRDFNLNRVERDIIRTHMFPLNLRLPAYKESVLVCIADKYCAAKETVLERKKAEE